MECVSPKIQNKINSKLDCFEVIVLDNFSNDNTFDVVNEFQQQFENLVYKKKFVFDKFKSFIWFAFII